MRSTITTKLHGLSRHLNPNEAIQAAMAAGNYEPEQTKWVIETLRPGSRFVDVGANFGHYSGLASSIVGPEGRVFAFEPSPIGVDSLNEMITENRITNIELCPAAVGECAGEIEIHLPPPEEIVHSPSAFATEPSFTPHRVPMIALDSYLPLNDGVVIDLIKVDVEGYEPNVIAGMKSLIRRGLVRNIACEFNSGWLRHNNSMTPAGLLQIILELGFSISAMTEKVIGMERGGSRQFELQDILFRYTGEGAPR